MANTAAQTFVEQYLANNKPKGSSGLTGEQRDAQAAVAKLVKEFGLTGLEGWILDKIKGGAGIEEIYLEIQDTPQFRERFPAIGQMRDAGAPHVPSPEEYLQLEDHYRAVAKQAGLVPQMLNQGQITKLIAGGVSPAEFDERVQKGYQRVAQADPVVRDTFAKYFGVLGDQALASYFLDPAAATPVLIEQATAAQLGGAGHQVLGEWFGADRMVQLARNGWDEQSARQGFDQLGQMAGLFDETVGEARQKDLTAEREGVSAVFGVDQQPDGMTTLDNATKRPLANDPLNGQDGENRTRGQFMQHAGTGAGIGNDGAFAGTVASGQADVSGDGSAVAAQQALDARRRNRVAGSTGRSSSYRGRQGETSGLGTADR